MRGSIVSVIINHSDQSDMLPNRLFYHSEGSSHCRRPSNLETSLRDCHTAHRPPQTTQYHLRSCSPRNAMDVNRAKNERRYRNAQSLSPPVPKPQLTVLLGRKNTVHMRWRRSPEQKSMEMKTKQQPTHSPPRLRPPDTARRERHLNKDNHKSETNTNNAQTNTTGVATHVKNFPAYSAHTQTHQIRCHV